MRRKQIPVPRFSAGQMVRTKDGLRVMLVDDFQTTLGLIRYRCMWMDTDGEIQFQDFAEDELIRVEA